jgi:4a-hydroxytetrahydrobiopterin dehydratase
MVNRLEEKERTEILLPVLNRGWALVEGRDAIQKTFLFKDFSEAFGFMTRAALVAEKLDHHPEWFNVWNRVEITLSTHDAGGLSSLDITMATALDGLMASFKSPGSQ